MKLIYAAAFVAITAAPCARAQNMIIMQNGDRNNPGVLGQTISLHFQISQPTPTTASTSDLTNIMASTTQSLYDIVNHECDILSVSLKGSCRLVQVNVGANISDRVNGRGPFVSANVNATFEIAPPASAEPATAPAVTSPAH